MKEWNEFKKNLKSLSEFEKYEFEVFSRMACTILVERKKQNMTLEELSKKSEIDIEEINKIETWDVKPDFHKMLKLLFVLNINIKCERKD